MYVCRGLGRLRGLGASALADQIASAITRQEGVNGAYNNPGALRSGPGQIGTSPSGFAIFPDLATGQAALENQVQLNIDRGLTLQTFFAGQRDASGNVIPGGYAGYAPAADKNQPNVYAANVSTWTGIDPTIPLNSLTSGTGAGAGSSYDTSGYDLASVTGFDLSSIDWNSWVPWATVAALGISLVLVLRGR